MADLTDDIYWAHQPKPLRAFAASMAPADRSALAESLSAQGFIVDPLIMGYGWDAIQVMNWRQRNGIPWDLPYGHPLAGQFAFTFPNPLGLPLYPETPPRGAILTSTDAKDFPPIDPPAQKPPQVPADALGAESGVLIGGKKQYFVDGRFIVQAGDSFAGPEGPLVAVERDTPWGRYQRWNPAV